MSEPTRPRLLSIIFTVCVCVCVCVCVVIFVLFIINKILKQFHICCTKSLFSVHLKQKSFVCINMGSRHDHADRKSCTEGCTLPSIKIMIVLL